MTSPVLQALAAAGHQERLAGWQSHEQLLADQVEHVLGTYPETAGCGAEAAALADFFAWCATSGVRACPAQPATIAQFILEHAALGMDELSAIAGAVAGVHQRLGLANPAATWMVDAALMRVGRVVPPRSWPDKQKARFVELPADLRDYVLQHERQREKALRRAQNEAAALRQRLAALENRPDAALAGPSEPSAGAHHTT